MMKGVEMLEVTIKGNPQEIAALVVALQERRENESCTGVFSGITIETSASAEDCLNRLRDMQGTI